MDDSTKVQSPHRLAQVRKVANDGHRLYLEYRNGETGQVNSPQPLSFQKGDLVCVLVDANQLSAAPEGIWPERFFVGVVRVKGDDWSIVYSGGRLKKVPTRTDLHYDVGNTVEASTLVGVRRVLTDTPVEEIKLRSEDEIDLSRFKSDVNDITDTFDDFGGLKNVVSRAKELIEIPLKNKKKLVSIGVRPVKGVLFSGPPGTGKTMLARVIANSTEATFYNVGAAEVLSKWYGESTRVLRQLFEDARNQEQAIIFFDEIDSIAIKRDGDTHEATRRVVAQLLALMDGFERADNVIVIATTNRREALDDALLRPGRFDWEVKFPLPDAEDRRKILRASSKALQTELSIPWEQVVEETESWSGAELTQIWSEAALLAVADGRSKILNGDFEGGLERVALRRKDSRGGG